MVFPVWLDFFDLAWFFQFQTYKTETEPVSYLKILIGLVKFFLRFSFFNFFFDLIDFLAHH
jgi:hypothetical protein